MPSATKTTAAAFVPNQRTLPILRQAVQGCKGCGLYRTATQAVFGEIDAGRVSRPSDVDIMIVGEQPGDHEDRTGRPFVGPAGKLLDTCLDQAQIERRKVYIANVVKHFKWEPRGKIRLHKKPNMQEIHACRPWLDAELEVVPAKLIVCLGATAAQALLGSEFKITQSHGKVQTADQLPHILATLHPSAILRARTSDDRKRQRSILVNDLRKAAAFVESIKN